MEKIFSIIFSLDFPGVEVNADKGEAYGSSCGFGKKIVIHCIFIILAYSIIILLVNKILLRLFVCLFPSEKSFQVTP